MAKSSRIPWKKPNPRKRTGQSSKLTPAQKAEARANAERAGRRYPNLIDNMRVASKAAKSPTTSGAKKKVGRKRAAHKTAATTGT
jgi:hypothetical protein